MKKENKKMAQERRAEERRQKEKKAKIKKYLSIGIPSALIAILIIVIIVDAVKPFSSSDDTEEASTESVTESAEAAYSTDTSLTIEDGDTVNIDYVGSIDGVEFSGGSTDGAGTDLTIGSGTYIDDFEEQLIGYHPGDTVDVTVTFPEDYGVDELNGQEAVFEVTINGIYES
ncbi:MAG: FKBP-type peptidyl-prolyl cis-trans isomerase [Lachnospiraceae bacterium]|nr:FKBP-type peptidyl-prolyl cis-trans isomerase [Lachnospiraceae bacterium]